MACRKLYLTLPLLILYAATGFAGSTLAMRQSFSWSDSPVAQVPWAYALTYEIEMERADILGGIRYQSSFSDFSLASDIWLGPKTKHNTHNYPAVLKVQTHCNVLKDAGSNLELAISCGQSIRTNSPSNWWGFDYSVGAQMSLSFSPYIDKVLVNFEPVLLLSVSKAFANRVFLELVCDTNSLFWYTSQLTFMVGGAASVRITDSICVGASTRIRFSDLMTERRLITMGEISLFIDWIGGAR